MKRFLGAPCPTCGSTRAAVLLLQGDVAGAFAVQPLVTFVFVVVMPLLVGTLLFAGRRRTKALAAVVVRHAAFWIVFAVVALANWAYVIWRGN